MFEVDKINIIFNGKNNRKSNPVELLLNFRQPYPMEYRWCIDDVNEWYSRRNFQFISNIFYHPFFFYVFTFS